MVETATRLDCITDLPVCFDIRQTIQATKHALTFHLFTDNVVNAISYMVIYHFQQLRGIRNHLFACTVPRLANDLEGLVVRRCVLNFIKHRIQVHLPVIHSVNFRFVLARFLSVKVHWINAAILHQLLNGIGIFFLNVDQVADFFFTQQAIVFQ
ncbi:MAG: hypothetical protein ACD_85C00007G0001 [uncultured bacterium]|nr:MAG: hypothetical protein ACD_85C00007G0001 [uncultured bacterium]